ncbi:uncharacterized protein K441DRAFT_566632, partial [Cenococcum geophilum 1.58]|uniref:uncharacterized protein n=1 Tax=Cenococcum geophilum 1.58 TaxID=794803 RepID=UPI00358DFED4
KHTANSGERIPLLRAAAILTIPSRLLSVSVVAIFIILGIYLGSIYTARLGTLKGSSANLVLRTL